MSIGYSRRTVFTGLLIIASAFCFASCSGGGGLGNSSSSSAKSWGTPELIDNKTGVADSAQIAMDPDGNAMAVWVQYDGVHDSIYANYYNGASWGTAERIEEVNVGDADSPQVAMDQNGNALAVWQQYDGAHYSIYVNYYDGASWGTAEAIETDDTNNAYVPQIAMNSGGHAVAVWEQRTGTGTYIWANYFDGSEWDTAERIISSNADSPQIAMDDDGNAMVVWREYNFFPYNIRANYYDGTSWGVTKLLDYDNSGSAYYPQISMNADGAAMAVWQQYDSFRYNAWANYFGPDPDDEDAVPAWDVAKRIENDGRGNAEVPQVAMDNNGNAIAVWVQYDGVRMSVYANRYNGTSWGSAELIETDNSGDADYPQIAIDKNGNAVAVWEQDDGTRTSIRTNYYDGTSWGSAELIDQEDDDDVGVSDSPQIAMDQDGAAVAVWVQFDGAQFSIYANHFD